MAFLSQAICSRCGLAPTAKATVGDYARLGDQFANLGHIGGHFCTIECLTDRQIVRILHNLHVIVQIIHRRAAPTGLTDAFTH
jgi:hypothetical protein